MQTEVESGFTRPEEENYTLDQVVTMNTIKREVEGLERELDNITIMWQNKEKEIGQKMQMSDLEQAMKTVSCGLRTGLPMFGVNCQVKICSMFFEHVCLISLVCVKGGNTKCNRKSTTMRNTPYYPLLAPLP